MRRETVLPFALAVATVTFGVLMLYDAPTWGAMGFGFVAFWLTIIRFDPRVQR